VENREVLLHDVILEVFRNIRSGIEALPGNDDDIYRVIRNLAELIFEQQKGNLEKIYEIYFRLIHRSSDGWIGENPQRGLLTSPPFVRRAALRKYPKGRMHPVSPGRLCGQETSPRCFLKKKKDFT